MNSPKGFKFLIDIRYIDKEYEKCQGTSKTGSILDVQVPAELQQIYKGSLKGNASWLND